MVGEKWLSDIIAGFDFSKPVYVQHLFPGDAIYQYIRNPAHSDLSPARGNWFCLPGALTDQLAISEGLAGRRLHKFRVDFALIALEGTAAPMTVDRSRALGGLGGVTQLFIPPAQILRIRPSAAQERW